MTYDWFDEYMLAKPGAERDFKAEWQATRYLIRGKMFCMVGGDKNEKPIITLKLEPAHGDLLRQTYPDVVPGYYMNKEHWNSVYQDGDVPHDVLRQMCDESHGLILASLSKKVQKEILGE